MDFEGLFSSLPLIIELFVPGFVFIKIYSLLCDESTSSFESTAVISLVLSYVFRLLSESINVIIGLSDGLLDLATVGISILCAIVLSVLKVTGCVKRILIVVGRTTGNNTIWKDAFDLTLGSTVRCYAHFNHEEVIITGDVKYYEACDDGECNIALEKYQIKYKETGFEYTPDKKLHALLLICTRNIHGLEVIQGTPKNSNKKRKSRKHS